MPFLNKPKFVQNLFVMTKLNSFLALQYGTFLERNTKSHLFLGGTIAMYEQ